MERCIDCGERSLATCRICVLPYCDEHVESHISKEFRKLFKEIHYGAR